MPRPTRDADERGEAGDTRTAGGRRARGAAAEILDGDGSASDGDKAEAALEEGEPQDEEDEMILEAEALPPPDLEMDETLPEDDGRTLDMPSTGLVPRAGVAMPRGEWVRRRLPPSSDHPGEPQVEVEEDVPRVDARGDSLYQTFVREATRVPRLSEEEERALGRKVRDFGDKAAAKKLVVHNLRLVIKMAHQYRRAWTNLMDLVQEASAGMAIAAQRWDPDQGTRFGTYAVYWIRAQLTKFLMTHGRAIHTGTTRAGRKLYFQLPRIRRQLLAEGREPTIEAIAEVAEEDPQEVARIVARLDGREASLDAQVGEEDGGTLGDMLAGDQASPEANAARQEVSQLVEGLMQRFEQKLDDERDRAIWREHLIAQEPKSLVELGARYGVSKQRMGQLATRIKRAFRRHVIEELGPNTQLHWLFSQD